MKTRWLCTAVCIALLTGCVPKLKDNYSSNIFLAKQWHSLEEEKEDFDSESSGTQADLEKEWWSSFKDPILDSLIEEAIKGNSDLKIAKARVEQAKAARELSSAQLAPQVQANGSLTRNNQSTFAEIKPFNTAQANLQASWELDIFGQNQHRLQEAEAILQSEEANSQAVMIALLAEVARNYFDLLNYKQQVQIIKDNLDGQAHTLTLIKSLRKEAMATELDLQRAGSQVATTKAQLPDIQHAYNAALNRLNILTGAPPGTIDGMFKNTRPMQPIAQKILLSAPAEVIANRPDVRVAERRFASKVEAEGAAKAEIFPKISLTGLFGLQRNPFVNYNPFALGLGVAQPILSFGRIQSQINIANAEQKQAYFNYQKTVLEALGDMENALSSYLNETRKNKALKEAVGQNQKALALVREQFKQGYSDLLNVETVELNLLQSQASLAASDAKLRKDLVGIYTAAGGGWDTQSP